MTPRMIIQLEFINGVGWVFGFLLAFSKGFFKLSNVDIENLKILIFKVNFIEQIADSISSSVTIKI